jgi:hypothetical protein
MATPNPDARGIASRRAAWRILLEQEKSRAFLKDLFPAHLKNLSREDAGLARTLCLGVLRWQRLLDYNLDLQAERGVKDARLRMLLRLAAYQLFSCPECRPLPPSTPRWKSQSANSGPNPRASPMPC